MRFVITSRTSATAISFVLLLGLSSALSAQPAKPPTLEEILERLEANLNHYDTRLPSLFCDEHVVSQVEPGLHNNQDTTITDSVFRLKRTPNRDHTTTLVESREIKSVDGKPPTSQKIDGPAMLTGAFEGGLAVVSLNQTACMSYTLQRINKNRPADPYVVRFNTVLTPHNTAACLLKENSKGHVLIDPASMQITHLELTTPHHTIIPGDAYSSPIVGQRVITVGYAPIQLGSEIFWMPSTISMQATNGSGTFHKTVWWFSAMYHNYHKLEVRSRILPDGEVPAP